VIKLKLLQALLKALKQGNLKDKEEASFSS